MDMLLNEIRSLLRKKSIRTGDKTYYINKIDQHISNNLNESCNSASDILENNLLVFEKILKVLDRKHIKTTTKNDYKNIINKQVLDIKNIFQNKETLSLSKPKIIHNSDLITGFNMNDVSYFLVTNNKGKNDEYNKKREEVLVNMTYTKYFGECKPINRRLWNDIYIKWNDELGKLCDKKYDKYEIYKKAGRKFNHDFDIKYYYDGNLVDECKLEFKHNARSIEKLPQILSLSEKNRILGEDTISYAEFWYTNYLHKVIEGLENIKPDKKEYLKNVYKAKCNDCLFTEMYNNDIKNSEFYIKKDKLVNESISEYLKLYGKKINIEKVLDKLKKTQDKIFILWDPNDMKFRVERVNFNSCFFMFKNIRNNNTIVISSRTHEYSFLLRWKNRKGILFPAWQISYKKF